MKKMHFPAYQDAPYSSDTRSVEGETDTRWIAWTSRVQTRLGLSWFDLCDGYRGCGGFRSAADAWNTSLVEAMEGLKMVPDIRFHWGLPHILTRLNV